MPLAVDTNVRALVDDGSAQAARSRKCLMDHQIYIPESVLLETEWFLRSRMKQSRLTINMLLAGLLSVKNTIFDSRQKIRKAILAHENGLDFADALHLY